MEEIASEDQRFIYRSESHELAPRDITHASAHETVQEIHQRAFHDCRFLLEVNLNMGLQAIGRVAFKNCLSLKKLSVPVSVRIIGFAAFSGCGSLAEVELLEGLQEIHGQAFINCRLLQRIYIPSTVEKIGECAFGYCQSLREVLLQNGQRHIMKSAFQFCYALSHLHMPSTVHTIGDSAFAYCTGLVEVELNEGLVNIEYGAFIGCTSLCAIFIPCTTTSIGALAFNDCKKLFGVEFASAPTSRLELVGPVFSNCSALVNVSIPSTVVEISGSLFYTSPLILGRDRFGRQMLDKGDKDKLQARYGRLPIHEVCYHVSTITTDDLKNRLAVSSNSAEDCLVDFFGLTPLHILATSPILRTDLLKLLLDHYPFEIVSLKDGCGQTMMDYLLENGSSKTIPMIQMVLSYTVITILSGCGLEEWRTSEMASQLEESIQWDVDSKSQRQNVTRILTNLIPCFQVEVTSILELALWKMKIISNSNSPSHEVDRESCRMVCNAEDVISNVVGFLWDDESSALPSNVFPNSYHIISMKGI